MYIYYVLHGTRQGQPVELEGDIIEEQFPSIDLNDGVQIIERLIDNLRSEGTVGEWTACELTDSLFDTDEYFIFFHNRWIRRADAPWRKDRNN